MIARNVLSSDDREQVEQIARAGVFYHSTPVALRVLANAILRVVEGLEQQGVDQPTPEDKPRTCFWCGQPRQPVVRQERWLWKRIYI